MKGREGIYRGLSFVLETRISGVRTEDFDKQKMWEGGPCDLFGGKRGRR